MPAAAVIPAPIVYDNIAAVKTFVVAIRSVKPKSVGSISGICYSNSIFSSPLLRNPFGFIGLSIASLK